MKPWLTATGAASSGIALPVFLPPRLIPPVPWRERPRHQRPISAADLARQPLLHILTQPVVQGQFRRLRPTRPASLPSTASPTHDLKPLAVEYGDLFTFHKRQIAARDGGNHAQRHVATFPEPPATSRLRHADRNRSVLTGQPTSKSHARTRAQPLAATPAHPATSSATTQSTPSSTRRPTQPTPP